MLILSRKAGEKIVIGSNVTVTVLAVSANRLRIGIDAPNGIRIRRTLMADQLSDPINVPTLPEAARYQ